MFCIFVLASVFCGRGCPQMPGNPYFFVIRENGIVDWIWEFSGWAVWPLTWLFLCLFPWACHVPQGVLFKYPAWRSEIWPPAFWKLNRKSGLEVLSTAYVISHSVPSIIPIYSLFKNPSSSSPEYKSPDFSWDGKGTVTQGWRVEKGISFKEVLFPMLSIFTFLPLHS